MKTELKTLDNKKAGEITLPASIFGCEAREDLIARVINWQLAKRRSGTHSTKRIQDVSGTGKKPFKQKGTGNARQGSLRAPQMRGGATMHGALPRDHGYDLQKKVRALGLKSALSVKASEKKIVVLEDFSLKTAKTKDLAARIANLGLTSALFIDGDNVNSDFLRAVANLINIDAMPTQGANVYDIMRHDVLVLSKAAVEKLEARLA
ncbi:MAG: 50S ribosomal protein L4 [Alphaproteobacteria bacterium]|nr:50S ribosomal protein L4 [Alphaproteobacteria bacterium]NCQ66548.1 50S ribosomal protein L4 [Alphaproteobacteria bacterium]NCT08339.1 50S ribosomal protein L4 [Alphaproteobacteria bacterium]